MGQIKLGVVALGAALFLAACGGGGEGAYPSITGLAATGAALTNASIALTCANGTSASGTTGADGTFTVQLSGGQLMPCLVKVTKGSTTLFSVATGAGRLNVTPLTDLVVTKALGSDPVAAFNTFDSTKGATIVAGLAAAKTHVAGQLTSLGLTALVGDPLTSNFVVGDADDAVLDAFKAKMDAAGLTPEARRVTLIAAQPLTRGTLVGTPSTIYTHTMASIDTSTTSSGLIGLAGAAKCDVKVVPLNYNTVGVNAEAATASGVLLLPSGTDPACTASKTLVAYAKGTDVKKNRSLSTPTDTEAFLLVAMYAAQGHAVVATDYLGFGVGAPYVTGSNYSYHPYLHADSEASSIVDVIRAGRAAAATVGGANLSGRVMVTGYSQGGHASMAAQRAIESKHSSEINLILGAHLAGPYNLAASFRVPDVVNGQSTVVAGIQFFLPYIITSWQKVYGDLYASRSTVFQAPYDGLYIESLLPSDNASFTSLIVGGSVPGLLGETPVQARDKMFQAAYLTDMNTNLTSPAYLAAKKNDLLGWTPAAQTLLCGGSYDPTVPYALHAQAGYADLHARAPSKVSLVDVNPYIAATYATVLTNTPATYYANYHGSYEPPFCAAQARAKLAAVLATL